MRVTAKSARSVAGPPQGVVVSAFFALAMEVKLETQES
jgi:hypothetical protein